MARKATSAPIETGSTTALSGKSRRSGGVEPQAVNRTAIATAAGIRFMNSKIGKFARLDTEALLDDRQRAHSSLGRGKNRIAYRRRHQSRRRLAHTAGFLVAL